MYSKINIVALFCLFTGFVIGQNSPRFSQANSGKGILNPAAVGSEAKFSAELLYRYQWIKVKGAPSTTGFVAAYEIDPSMAVGLSAIHDRVGINFRTSISGSYAYRLIFNEEQYISLGVKAGIENTIGGYDKVQLTQQNDPAFSRGYNTWLFNAGVGVYYNGPNAYIGYALPRIFDNEYQGGVKGFKTATFHHYATAGFYLGNKKGSYVFNPIMQVKYAQNSPVQGDIILRNIIQAKYAFSLGYRTENALIAGVDFMFGNNLKVGYAFNYNLDPISKYTGQAHELYIAVGLPFYYRENPFGERRYLNGRGSFNHRFKRKARKNR